MSGLLDLLTASPRYGSQVTHVEHVPARTGRTAGWPDWVAPLLVDRLSLAGIKAP